METGSSHTPPSRSRPERSGIRILLVDDETTVRQFGGQYLRDSGHYVETADDGEQALQRFKDDKWDLVITDRVMPKLSGDGLAKAIRKLDATIPIILITAFADRSSGSEAENAPFAMILRKPFTRETLTAAVSSCLLT